MQPLYRPKKRARKAAGATVNFVARGMPIVNPVGCQRQGKIVLAPDAPPALCRKKRGSKGAGDIENRDSLGIWQYSRKDTPEEGQESLTIIAFAAFVAPLLRRHSEP
jgi:hypothetical protein